MIKATLLSLTMIGLFSTNAFAERRLDLMWKEQLRQHQEQQKCLKSAEYCEEKAKLHEMQIERLMLTRQYNEAANALKKECKRLTNAQRMAFDPIDNRYPIRKHCSEYSSYKVAYEKTAQAPAIKAQIDSLSARIQEQTAVVAELAAKIAD